MSKVVRRMKPGDIGYLLNIELKCFEDNLSIEKLRENIEELGCQVLVVQVDSVVVGYIMWLKDNIIRLAVKPNYRRVGFGTLLLYSLSNIITKTSEYSRLSIAVPESLCQPNTPEDVSRWLLNKGFLACKVFPGCAIFAGQEEDAYQFVKLLD